MTLKENKFLQQAGTKSGLHPDFDDDNRYSPVFTK